MWDDEDDNGQDEEEGLWGAMNDPIEDLNGDWPQRMIPPEDREAPSDLQRLAFMLVVIAGTAAVGMLIGLVGEHGSLQGLWVGAAIGAFCGVGLILYGIRTIGKN